LPVGARVDGAYAGCVLNTTPPDRLTDARGRPYFLWDEPATTLAEFLSDLRDPDPSVRAYTLGKLMRQAKPDDVLTFVSPHEIVASWPSLERHLGKTLAFWSWLVATWRRLGLVDG
jgi:hypothetical protein